MFYRKTLISCLMAALLLAVLPLALSADERSHPGYVDFDGIVGFDADAAVVDIRVGGWLMGLARSATEDDPEASAFMSGIESVRVRVFETRGNAAHYRDEAQAILDQLQGGGWEEFARITGRDELVYVMVKGDSTRIDGITLVAVGDDDEAVFINVTGSIDPRNVARIINEGDFHADLDFEV